LPDPILCHRVLLAREAARPPRARSLRAPETAPASALGRAGARRPGAGAAVS